jgi:hypothetical protein
VGGSLRFVLSPKRRRGSTGTTSLALFEVALFVIALKGPNNLAQGNALGGWIAKESFALKGQNNGPRHGPILGKEPDPLDLQSAGPSPTRRNTIGKLCFKMSFASFAAGRGVDFEERFVWG